MARPHRATPRLSSAALPLAVLAALLASGCDDGGDDAAPAAELSTARHAPAAGATCDVATLQRAVASMTGVLATQVKTATVFEEGTLNGGAASAANPLLPKHCIVTGTLDAHTGAPGTTAYGNNFRLRLPASWNGRFLFMGGGGNNGSVGNALGDLRDGSRALTQGFAVIAQDSGHAGSSPTFALDAQAYKDFAHESVHDASLVAKALIQGYYAKAPDRSYFVGCSNGGREAMVSAQRYDDFDGVVAGAPALNMFDQWTQDVWSLRTVATIVGTPAGVVPTATSGAFTDEQLAAIGAHFVAKCDALDGAADGLIADYKACTVAPKDLLDLQCAAQGGTNATAQCLSAAQVAGLRRLYDGPKNSAGQPLYTGHHPGHVETGWRGGLLGSGPTGLGSWYASIIPNMAYFGYGHLGYPGAAADPTNPALYPTGQAYAASFDFDTEPQKLQAGRLQMHGDNVDPLKPGPNFETFQRRGGRMLIYGGTGDASVKTPGLVAFMDTLDARYTPAGAAAFARLFVVPGMAHCGGGKAADAFDQLTPLMKWVELGTPPERIVARANAALDPAGVGISRPLCPHPKVARWRGTGDVNAADSHACAE